jgi:hypothetical protein
MKSQEAEILRSILPERRSDPEIVEHADPDRLMMTGQVHGYPLFALAEVLECKRAHDSNPALEQNLRFTLPELEARRWDVMPMSSDDAARSFALALALQRVRRDLQRYAYTPGGTASSAVPIGDASSDPGEARRSARDAFGESGYAALLSREIEHRAAREGNQWLLDALKKWLEEEEQRAAAPDYPEEFRTDLDRAKSYYRSIQF